MINNIGKTSGVIRLTVGLSILTMYFTQVLTGSVGTVLFSLAGVLLISGIFRSDPVIYLRKVTSKKTF